MSANPVISNQAYCLVHVPDLVRHGSKPRRERQVSPTFDARLKAARRPFAEAVGYAPNQAFIGNLTPDELARIPQPWFGDAAMAGDAPAIGPFGEIVSQDLFYAVLKCADVVQPALVALVAEHVDALSESLRVHPVLSFPMGQWGSPITAASLADEIQRGDAVPLLEGDLLRGCVRRDNRAEGREDDNLSAPLLLEALAAKASGAIALQWLLHREGLDRSAVDFIISCGEEAAGDRYQRGGGGMAKAIGEMCGCANASGMDVKNFCAGPGSALITAGAMVMAGLYERVVVVAGGSVAKLGMKSAAMLAQGLPILGDCLGAIAFLVTRDDGASPILRLDPGAVGMANIGSSTSEELVYRHLISRPLEKLDLTMHDVDKFAPELHNPEIMVHSGTGDVARKNYGAIAALAVMAGVIAKDEMKGFIDKVGMVGFAPPQGHIPSAVPYLGHAAEAMRRGEIGRAMFVCKASLFLNRLTGLYDGVSFILEANPKAKER
jgi:betaine reductase